MSNPDSTEREAAWQAFWLDPIRTDKLSPSRIFGAGWDARDAAVRELVEAVRAITPPRWRQGEDSRLHRVREALKPFVSPPEEVAR